MESETYAVRQRHLREALAREVWLGFKAGRLAVNGQRPQCPHQPDSNHAAVWLAAVEVSLHPEFFKSTVPAAPTSPHAESGSFIPSPSTAAASIEEKLEAALDEIVALTARVIDLEYAVKIMQPASEPASKARAKKAKAK